MGLPRPPKLRATTCKRCGRTVMAKRRLPSKDPELVKRLSGICVNCLTDRETQQLKDVILPGKRHEWKPRPPRPPKPLDPPVLPEVGPVSIGS